MTDLWGFLLQTLTASGTAVLLLAVKAMFRDTLPPRWQFRIWGILGVALLIPAGFGKRYALADWPLFVEAAKSFLTGEYGTVSRVIAPVPLPSFAAPSGLWDGLYLVYAGGTAFFLLRYLFSYVRLRAGLSRKQPSERADVQAAAGKYGLRGYPAVTVEGLPSAFACGVLHPVLVLPPPDETDEKVLLHELLHLKYHDTAKGLVLCLFRSLHWCNPLLWYCAGRAAEDLEALCDQRVLERLEGDARRAYGRVLLSAAECKPHGVPGTSSLSGGRGSLRRRIEAIARFRRYPAGIRLVSACIAAVLAVPLLAGVQERALADPARNVDLVMASARTVRCSTPDGAFDTYAKAVLAGDLSYRALCTPLSGQNALAEQAKQAGNWDWTETGLPGPANVSFGYRVYNVVKDGENAREGLLAVELQEGESAYRYAAVQPVRAEKQDGRWVVLPLGGFRVEPVNLRALKPDEASAPGIRIYEAQSGDFRIRLLRQTVSFVEPPVQESPTEPLSLFSARAFRTTPQPDGRFVSWCDTTLLAFYTGSDADKARYTDIGCSAVPLSEGDIPPETLPPPGAAGVSGSSTDGRVWGSGSLYGDWENPVFLSGGGSETDLDAAPPGCYAAALSLNGGPPEVLALLPVEGGRAYAEP